MLVDEAAPLTRPSLAELFRDHYDVVWRFLRRLGLSQEDADDGAQEVFLVVQRRLLDVEPGRERAFLLGTAMRVSQGRRRTYARRRDVVVADEVPDVATVAPDPAEALQRKQERAVLDAILDEFPIDLRAVFVLYELEDRTMAEIADDLELAPGTVASRLRRARELFGTASTRLQARDRRTKESR
jgi:RNA polymerase sigma-70 factor (ECF subfamily)